MKTLHDIAEGDEIVMIYRSGRIKNGKSADLECRAVVTEAKRINLTVQELPPLMGSRPREWKIRRDTGTDSAFPAGLYGWRGGTVEEREAHKRDGSARSYLREQGITIGLGSPWRGRDIELATVIRRHLESEAAQ